MGITTPILHSVEICGVKDQKVNIQLLNARESMGYCSIVGILVVWVPTHPVNSFSFQESIVKNTVVTPEEVEHYREEDIIPECEDRFPCLLCGVWSSEFKFQQH